MIEPFEVLLRAAVHEVFSTMVGLALEPHPAAACTFNGQPQIASSIGFTGQLTGVVYLYTTIPFAHRITRHLLRLPDPEPATEEMVNDVLGELANMVVGHFKSRLTDRGIPCVMTIPSIVRGSHFGIEPVSQTAVDRLGFHHASHYLVVEALLRDSRPAAA
ncbi:MAG: chemotaxis protein CheX [Verrucomicrobiales bacterium]|nr:chemotaxis protein CheX [Verrucomicrobiales bacterium]